MAIIKNWNVDSGTFTGSGFTTANTAPTFVSPGRGGAGQAIRIATTTSAAVTDPAASWTHGQWHYIRFAVKAPASAPTSGARLLDLIGTDGSGKGSIRWQTGSTLRMFTESGVGVGPTTTALTANQWYVIELGFKTSATANLQEMSWRIDGQLMQAPIATANTVPTNIRDWRVGALATAAGVTYDIDDLAMDDANWLETSTQTRLLTYGADGAPGDATPTLTSFPTSSSAAYDGTLGHRTGSTAASARLGFTVSWPGQVRYYVRAYVRISANPSVPITLLYLFNQAVGSGASLRLNADGTLTLLRNNAVVVGSNSAALTPNQWHYVELKVYSGASTTLGEAEGRLNGVVFATATAANVGTNATMDTLRVGVAETPSGATNITLDVDAVAGDSGGYPGELDLAPPGAPATGTFYADGSYGGGTYATRETGGAPVQQTGSDSAALTESASLATVLGLSATDSAVLAESPTVTPSGGAAPVVTITSQSDTTINAQAGNNSSDIAFSADQSFIEYQVRRVASADDDVTEGTLVESATVSSRTSHTVTITYNETVAAGSTMGANLHKVFVKNAGGQWSGASFELGLRSKHMGVGAGGVENNPLRHNNHLMGQRIVFDQSTYIRYLLTGFNLEGVYTDENNAAAPTAIRTQTLNKGGSYPAAPSNLPGGWTTGSGRIGYAHGNGGLVHFRLCGVDASGLPDLGNVIAQETINAVQAYKRTQTEWGFSTLTQLIGFFMDVTVPAGEYVIVTRNAASDPYMDYFSHNLPTHYGPVPNAAVPNLGNNRNAQAAGAITGLDPRECVMWSTNSGGSWTFGGQIGNATFTDPLGLGRPNADYGYYGRSYGILHPWYTWNESAGADAHSNKGQPFMEYAGRVANSVTLTVQESGTLTKAGGWGYGDATNPGPGVITVVTPAGTSTTADLTGSGMVEGTLNTPRAVTAGQSITISSSRNVPRAESDGYQDAILAQPYPWGSGVPRAQLYAA